MPIQNDGVWWDKGLDGVTILKHDGTNWIAWDKDPQGPQPPDTFPEMSMSSTEERRRLLRMLRLSSAKFNKPLASGVLSQAQLGGDWNDYVQIVLMMILADTMLDIQKQLADLADSLKTVISTPPSNPID
jgi:hypothetical protein